MHHPLPIIYNNSPMTAATRALGALLFFCLSSATLPAVPPRLLVSAAANLRGACERLESEFEASTGIPVLFNFGATGKLAAQVEQGAPVDLLIAADTAAPRHLEGLGLTLPGSLVVYARGRLALWWRADSGLDFASLEDLARPQVRRIAIADPRLAPYGLAAQQALRAAGIWQQVQPRLVFAENVAQALQYAETGNVEAALTARSLCSGGQGRWLEVPAGLHEPLDQALVLIRGSPREADARRFTAFLLGPEGRRILESFGFEIPGGPR
jgi:molybdate transport system substrate-binding protein